jgi:O-antigen/teichoic acid export membrane protein
VSTPLTSETPPVASPGLYTRERTRRSLFDTVTYRAASQVATLISYIFLVRGLSKESFGILNLLYALIPVISTVASLGLEQTLRRFQPDYLRSGNAAAAAWLVRLVGFARLGADILLLALLLLLWNLVAPIFKLGPYRAEFTLFSVVILFSFQIRVLQLTLAAHMLHRFSVGSMAALAYTKCIVYGILLWQGKLTLTTAIVADTVASALTYIFLKWAHLKYCRVPGGPVFRPDATERRRLVRYSLFNNFNDAGAMLLGSRVDNFYIAALVNPIAVATYSFYVRLNEMAATLLPIRLFANVIQPLFFSVPANVADRRLSRYVSLLLNCNLLLQLPVMAFATAYHTEIVTVLFGGKYVEESWLLPVIVGFATLNIVDTPITMAAQHAERAGMILLSKIFVIYGIAATLILLPMFGLYGAAIATGSSQLFKNVFIWWGVRRTARWLNLPAVILMTVLIWGSAIAACYGAKTLVGAHAILNIALGVLICALAWLLYVRSPAVSASDREILGGVMRGRERRILTLLGLLPSAAART